MGRDSKKSKMGIKFLIFFFAFFIYFSEDFLKKKFLNVFPKCFSNTFLFQKYYFSRREILKNDPIFVVPDVIPELSTNRVLTTEYIYGEPLDKALNYDQDTRNLVMETFFLVLLGFSPRDFSRTGNEIGGCFSTDRVEFSPVVFRGTLFAPTHADRPELGQFLLQPREQKGKIRAQTVAH